MTRLEENGIIIDNVHKIVESKPYGPYEDMVVLQLSITAAMLTDISKSLAILADKVESKEELERMKNDMMHDIYMEGVNMAGEYQGCWVRFKDIENIVERYLVRKAVEGGNE